MLLMIRASAVFGFWAAEQRVRLSYVKLVIVTLLVSMNVITECWGGSFRTAKVSQTIHMRTFRIMLISSMDCIESNWDTAHLRRCLRKNLTASVRWAKPPDGRPAYLFRLGYALSPKIMLPWENLCTGYTIGLLIFLWTFARWHLQMRLVYV